MNRTIKEATVKRYHHDTHRQFETHLSDFIGTCKSAAAFRSSSTSPRTRSAARRVISSPAIAPIEKPTTIGPSAAANARAAIAAIVSSRVVSASTTASPRPASVAAIDGSARPIRASHMLPGIAAR